MKTSKTGIDLIKGFEGLRQNPYKLKGEQFYTVGYGHYGADVIPDHFYSLAECETLLIHDLYRFGQHVNKYVDIYNLNQNEFDALVSFAYNIGNIDKLTNYGKRKKDEIRTAWLLYCRGADGKQLNGLKARRVRELELFNTPTDDASSDDLYDYLRK